MSNEIWIAVIGALGGTGVVKIVENLLNKGKIRDDTATQFRKELREEVGALKAELTQVEKDLDVWKQKYYDLLGQFVQVKSELETALTRIRQYSGTNAKLAEQGQIALGKLNADENNLKD